MNTANNNIISSSSHGDSLNSIKNKFFDIKLCVFDMAGTTVNEGNLVYKTVCNAINEALNSAGKSDKQVSLELCLEYGAGKEKRNAIRDILNRLDLSDACIELLTDTAFATFKDSLATAYSKETLSEFEGMSELFEQLKVSGRKVVLNTGYDAKTANEILTVLGWSVGDQVDALVTADDVENGRPDPDMITLAMKRFNVDNSQQVLKAGDSGIDIEEGKNAGCGLVLGVLSGAQNEQQLVKYSPDVILDKLTELKELI
ncbi:MULTISPECIES: phosphonatase-like hydrolase [unclassified Psychrobacter]|uniref:phosphonatase-like hydrolase n=1 Tax=unclassified Psychrobacter TaxID=196806 RepID=UPI000EE79C0F|nr:MULTISPECIES: phosphonatase-like hydrolase [unclassified Psychrobacter]HCI76376.1 phosphonatase-like hydrolase [Psychrobacter sp.]